MAESISIGLANEFCRKWIREGGTSQNLHDLIHSENGINKTISLISSEERVAQKESSTDTETWVIPVAEGIVWRRLTEDEWENLLSKIRNDMSGKTYVSRALALLELWQKENNEPLTTAEIMEKLPEEERLNVGDVTSDGAIEFLQSEHLTLPTRTFFKNHELPFRVRAVTTRQIYRGPRADTEPRYAICHIVQ